MNLCRKAKTNCINTGLKEPIQLLLQNKVRLPNDATCFFLRVNKHRPNFQQYRVIHLEASMKTPKSPNKVSLHYLQRNTLCPADFAHLKRPLDVKVTCTTLYHSSLQKIFVYLNRSFHVSLHYLEL